MAKYDQIQCFCYRLEYSLSQDGSPAQFQHYHTAWSYVTSIKMIPGSVESIVRVQVLESLSGQNK